MLAGKTSNLGAETKTNRVEEVWPADNLNPLPQRVDNPQSKYAAIEFQSDDQTAPTFDNIYEPYDADASLDINTQQQKIRKKSKRRKKPEIIEEANSTDESTAQNERNMAARKRYLAGGNRPISINMNPNANASKLLKAKINEGYEMASLESITASEVNNSAGGKKMSTFSEGLDIPLDDGSFALPSSVGSVNMAERKPPIMMTGYADVGVRSSAINSSMSISVISNDRNSFYSTQSLSMGIPPPKKQDYYLPSILATIFCFITTGPYAIYNASKARKLLQSGDEMSSIKYYNRARYFFYSTVTLGIFLWISFIILIIVIATRIS